MVTLTFYGISSPPCTTGDRLKCSLVNVAVEVAPLSNSYFVTRDFSFGKWPTGICLILSYATLMLHYTNLTKQPTNKLYVFCRQTDKSDFIGRCRLMSSVQNSIALVNHVLCSKEIKIIALFLLHIWNKAMLEKVENDVPVIMRNNESEVT